MWGHFCRHKLAERPEQDIATWLKTRPPWKPCWNMLQTLAILNNLKTFLNNERPNDPMDKVRMQLATATAKQVPVTIPILWPLQSAQIHHVYSQCDREYMIIYAPRKVFGRSYIYILYSFNEVFLPDSPLPYRSWGPDLVFQLSNAALVLGLFLAPAPKRCRASVAFFYIPYVLVHCVLVGWVGGWIGAITSWLLRTY